MPLSDPASLLSRVNEAIDRVRPHLIADGGDVSVAEITTEMDVKIKWLGTCQNCSMSHMTLKIGLEEAIKNHVPEIRSIIAMNGLGVTNSNHE